MLKAAGIYSRNRSKGIVSAVCSRDSRRALSVCSINWGGNVFWKRRSLRAVPFLGFAGGRGAVGIV